MDIILDSAALLSGMINSLPGDNYRLIITDRIRDEIGFGAPRRKLDSLIDAGLIVSFDYNMDEAKDAASITGDIDRLSDADLSVIGLAIAIKGSIVMTDDFRVQNVLRSLGIGFQPAGEVGERTIRETWEWTFRCKGCGRYFEKVPGPDCPVCGHDIKKTRKRA